MNSPASSSNGESERVLKASFRPFIILGIAFGFIELLLLVVICKMGNLSAVLIGGAPIPVIYAAICLFITNQKIIVGTDYLAYQAPGGQRKAVNFKDITKSRAHELHAGTSGGRAGNYGGPVLDVYTSDAKRPALRIATGAFRQTDIDWLTSLPEMRFH